MEWIFLIGFMGAGKTTLGRATAALLGWHFIDLDVKIVAEEKVSIPELFKTRGEAWFRAREREALLDLEQQGEGPYLIACGGGTPCYEDNMEWLNAHGTTVYIQVGVPELCRRLEPDQDTRPMISAVAPADLSQHITKLLQQREPYYLQAHHLLDGEILSTAALAEIAQQTYK